MVEGASGNVCIYSSRKACRWKHNIERGVGHDDGVNNHDHVLMLAYLGIRPRSTPPGMVLLGPKLCESHQT